MEKHYWKMVRDTQGRVEKALRLQVLDGESPGYGGFAEETGIVQAKSSIYRIAPMAAAYCNEDSVFYRDGLVLERILLGLSYVRRVQHGNGLFDYVTCNFFSAPDTAFCIKKYRPLKRLWSFGNYSRFVRRGYVRVDVQTSTADQEKMLPTAFKGVNDEGKQELVMVFINENVLSQEFVIKGAEGYGRIAMHVTSDDHDLECVAEGDYDADAPVVIPAMSVTTVVLTKL